MVGASSLTGGAFNVAVACFVMGILLVLSGLIVGVYLSLKRVSGEVKKKLEDATNSVDELRNMAVGSALNAQADQAVAESVGSKADEVKGTLGDIGSIIGSLPEQLRFAGLLILIGAVLMSVGAVQFGGTSLF